MSLLQWIDNRLLSVDINLSRFSFFFKAHLLDQVHYSVDFGERALTYLEKWLGRQYQLPKVDFAAIPHFTFGAMENWGLITYR